MDLDNAFTVSADIDTAWATLLDVEAIAPCMPGATLTSFDGTGFNADVKVKLGPVTMMYAGEGKFVIRDVSTHTVVIQASGKESRGAGTAAAMITAQLVAEGPAQTRVVVNTDLTITGKAAQFGRGVIADVSKNLIGQFSSNLEHVIAARQVEQHTAERAAAGEDSPASTGRATSAFSAPDSINLLGTARGPVLKRAIPIAVGCLIAVGLVWWVVTR